LDKSVKNLKTWFSKLLPLFWALAALVVVVPAIGLGLKYSEWVSLGELSDFREGKVSAIRSIPISVKRSGLAFFNSLHPARKYQEGLPQVHLFIPTKSKEALLSDLPESAKRYQTAQMLYPDNKIRKVKVRIRGDNGRNYLLGKKSWRVKTKKSKLYRGSRIISFHIPREAIPIRALTAYRVAQTLGLVTPDVDLVELVINGSNYGVFIRHLHLNEEFLRNHGFMPVEIYKGDREIGDERSSGGNTRRVWQNVSQWDVLAQSGRLDEDRDLLKYALGHLNSAVFDNKSLSIVKSLFPIDVWAQYSVQDILLQNFHTSNHNIRLIADDQSGVVTPIIWDPIITFPDQKLDFWSLINKCMTPLVCLYKKSSDYRVQEIAMLYTALKNNVLTEVAHDIETELDRLEASINRDAFRYDVEPDIPDVPANKTASTILRLTEQLRGRERWLSDMLEREPSASWSEDSGVLELFLKGPIPIDQIKLSGRGFDQTKRVVFDQNNNGSIDKNDQEIPSKLNADGDLLLELSLFSNSDIRSDSISTRFKFILDPAVDVYSVGVRQLLTKNMYAVKRRAVEYQLPHSRNTPVVSKIPLAPRKIKEILEIRKTMVIEEPQVFMPGSGLVIHPGVSVIFREKVEFQGSKEKPITITSRSDQPFGVVAIHGKRASGSNLQHLKIQNGSQSRVNGTSYLGMLSIHDTENIVIKNLRASSNSGADDMLHVVYGENIVIESAEFLDAEFDAIDVDLSSVELKDLTVKNAGNDCVDIMGGRVTVRRANLQECGDKGISVGENAEAAISQIRVQGAITGVAAKDGSRVSIEGSTFDNSKIHFDGYKKNWRYGSAKANIHAINSKFRGNKNLFQTDKFASIVLDSPEFFGEYSYTGNVTLKH